MLTVFFGCSEREYQRGDEVAWYADGDKIVRNEYNPATAYAFGIFRFEFLFASNSEQLGFCSSRRKLWSWMLEF